jgi:hypothetical protein
MAAFLKMPHSVGESGTGDDGDAMKDAVQPCKCEKEFCVRGAAGRSMLLYPAFRQDFSVLR